MAKYNRARTEQRIVLLFHFAEALRQPHQSELPFEAAEAEFQAVSGHLWSQRSFYRAQSHDLAILLGGEALEEAAADIRRGWGPGMSVMQLHAREGYLPSRWLSADEEALREAIQGQRLSSSACAVQKKPTRKGSDKRSALG